MDPTASSSSPSQVEHKKQQISRRLELQHRIVKQLFASKLLNFPLETIRGKIEEMEKLLAQIDFNESELINTWTDKIANLWRDFEEHCRSKQGGDDGDEQEKEEEVEQFDPSELMEEMMNVVGEDDEELEPRVKKVRSNLRKVKSSIGSHRVVSPYSRRNSSSSTSVAPQSSPSHRLSFASTSSQTEIEFTKDEVRFLFSNSMYISLFHSLALDKQRLNLKLCR